MLKLFLIACCLIFHTTFLIANEGKKDTSISKKDKFDIAKITNDSILEYTKEIDQKINSLSETFSSLKSKNTESPESEFLFLKILIVGLILLQILTSLLIFDTKKLIKKRSIKTDDFPQKNNDYMRNFTPSLDKIKETLGELIKTELKNLSDPINKNFNEINKLLSTSKETANQPTYYREEIQNLNYDNKNSKEDFITEYNNINNPGNSTIENFYFTYKLKTLSIPQENNNWGLLSENLSGLLWLYFDFKENRNYIIFNKTKTLTNDKIRKEGLKDYFDFVNFKDDGDIKTYKLHFPAMAEFENSNYIFKGSKGQIELYY